MEGSFLRFYFREADRCHGSLAWEWLLQEANRLGVRGGSAFRAMAGFGHHHVVHESKFFELAGSIAIEVEFIVTEDEALRLLAAVEKAGVRALYARIPATFGILNPDPGDPSVAPRD
jgi:PII-like signaling protein